MAEIIKPPYFEEVVNAGEKRLLTYLEVNLSEDYYLIPNVELASTSPRNNRTKYWEYDLIVIAPHGIYNIENKDWKGRIEGDDNYWYLNDHQRSNPIKTNRVKSAILASKLKEEKYAWGAAWVETMVTLSYNNQYPPIISHEASKKTFELNQKLIDFIQTPESIGKTKNCISHIQHEIKDFIIGKQSKKGPEEKKEVLNHEIIEILQQEENFTEYLVKPKGATSVRRRIKEYALQVNGLTLDEQKKHEEQITNQYKALNNIKAKPYILNVDFRFDNENHLFYEISDYLDENSLRAEIRFKTFTFKEKIEIIKNIIVALEQAHEANIFHRDINPDNIFLIGSVAHLGNFGKSYFIDHLQEGYTVMQTIDQNNATAYHPLELTIGDASAVSDIYSLGVLVYWLFTGKEPFKTPYELDKLGGKLPEDLYPSSINPKLPKWIDEICTKTILTDGLARLESVKDIREIIDNAIQQQFFTESKEEKEEDTKTTNPSSFEELKEGDSIATYSIHKVLGRGGYSKVFKVKHRIQNEYFALKLFNESVTFNSVKDEYEALKDLDHPNIVKFKWNDMTSDGQFFTLMEYLNGENLSVYTRTEAKLPIHKVFEVGKDMLSALIELQSKSIIHRDLKPQNIIWDNGERFVLIDFNVASTLNENKDFVGTNPYLAPDLIEDDFKVNWDFSADTFSLGITLYELICKNYPWSNPKMPTLSKAPTPPKEYEKRISNELSDFLLKAISTKKENRFSTAQEMYDALMDIKDNLLAENDNDSTEITSEQKLYHTIIHITQGSFRVKLYDKMEKYVDLTKTINSVLDRFKDNLKRYKTSLSLEKSIKLILTVDNETIIREEFWHGGAKSYTSGNIERVYNSLQEVFEENKSKIRAHKVDVEGIDIIDYINSLYSQSKYGNYGTRVSVESHSFDDLTYTPTKLDRSLIPAILDKQYKLIIITGNAGDGKTAFIKKIENQNGIKDLEKFEHHNGARFVIDDTTFESNYDGSQDENDTTNNEVLEKFFSTFEGLDDYTKSEEGRIIAINEGRLVEFLTTSDKHKKLAKAIEDYFYEEGHIALPKGVLVVNLNLRSVVAGEVNDDGTKEDSLFKKQIKALTKKELWKDFLESDIAENSFIKYNVETFNDSAASDTIINRLEWLLRTVSFKRELHITMRDIRSFIAFLLTRDTSSEELYELENLRTENPEKYWQYYYFNITNPNNEDSGNNDRLIKLLRETDIGEVSIPQWDRELFFDNHYAKDFLEFSERENDLITSFNEAKEFVPAHEQSPEIIEEIRERHKTYVRHHYFEGKTSWTDDTQVLKGKSKPHYLLRLPYKSIFEFYTLLNEENIDVETKQIISRAISLNEGSNNEKLDKDNLVLASTEINDPYAKSFKLFPLDEFELFINNTEHLTRYLEYEPDSLVFRHKNHKHIKLTISLDLYEMLYYIKQGFSPSLNDLKGRFVELTIFKNLLHNLNYNEIVVTPDNRKFYSISKGDDVRIEINELTL